MDDAPNLAIFCDYENVAIGARDASYESFDILLVLERLLDKGKIVVKKAYADWERYKSAKRPMHEAAFELIEIPHVSYSGKNSADIRMVVDALDLCYTKAHVDVFVVISGDSDFSPLVSKLRENNKQVIGLGIKKASSDLLVDNCDEFIYYDDLVRERRKGGRKKAGRSKAKAGAAKENGKPAAKERDNGKGAARKPPKRAERPAETPEAAAAAAAAAAPPAAAAATPAPPAAAAATPAPPAAATAPPAAPAEADPEATPEEVGRREEAIELVLDTVEALFRERDDNLWGSMVKQTLKRKRPNFAETFYGYRTFNQLLEDAAAQGLLEIQKDERSGGYLIVSFGPKA